MSLEEARQLFLTRMDEGDLELLRSLGELADELGTSAYVVGGVVRDLLLERPNHDLDVVVEGDAIEFAGAAAERLGGSVKAHTRFGTVILVLTGGRKVDLATARSEVYERPGALPVVTPGAMEADLRRRDFTVNAMAFALNPDDFGTLLDPFDGRPDLDRGVLRVLTDLSFEDDPTRILRGVRFSARFGLSIETGTEALLRRAVDERRMDTVSGERLRNEIELILQEDDPWPPVFRLIDWGILSSMVEGLDVPLSVRETIVEIDRLLSEGEVGTPEPDRSMTLFMALLKPVSRDVRASTLERLVAGRRLRDLARELETLESDIMPALSAEDELAPSALHELLHGLSGETLLLARAAATGTPAADRVVDYKSRLSGVRSTLTGADLVKMGVPEGKNIGEILRALLRARLDGEVSSDEDERQLAERLAGSLAESLTSTKRIDSVAQESTSDGSIPEAPEMNPEELLEQQSATETEPATPDVEAVAPDASAETSPEASAGTSPEASAGTSPETPAEAAGAGDAPAAVAIAASSTTPNEQSIVRRPVYEVHLDEFDGPLDLLLHLIREHEIDIYDIPIAKITAQYLDYLNFMESLDLALAGEFLEMAATLIRIKVQMLLPKETDENQDEEDPREQLVRKLVEYKQFKEVAGDLSGKEEERRQYFPRGVDPKSYADLEEEEVGIEEFLRDVTLFDLVDSLREVLSRVPERVDMHSVDMEEVTVEDRIDYIRAIMSERSLVPFLDIFGKSASRYEIIATFIAMLELIRLGEVRALQKSNFGEIEIQARVED